EDLAGQSIDAVDPHRIRPAHAMRATASQRERVILLPLDPLDHVEHAVVPVGVDPIGLPVGRIVPLGVVALDLDRQLAPRRIGGGHELSLSRAGWPLQYFRISIGYLSTRCPSFSM